VAALVGGVFLARHTADAAGKRAGREAARVVDRNRAVDRYAADVRLTDSLRATCRRGNVRTAESNRRATLHERQDQAIGIIARGARDARLATFLRSSMPEDKLAAVRYLRALDLLRTIHFAKVPLTDCRRAWPYPPRP
jgi:hypothetical protein